MAREGPPLRANRLPRSGEKLSPLRCFFQDRTCHSWRVAGPVGRAGELLAVSNCLVPPRCSIAQSAADTSKTPAESVTGPGRRKPPGLMERPSLSRVGSVEGPGGSTAPDAQVDRVAGKWTSIRCGVGIVCFGPTALNGGTAPNPKWHLNRSVVARTGTVCRLLLRWRHLAPAHRLP